LGLGLGLAMVDQVNDPVQEKISEKNGSTDHYGTQRHTEQGFQVDHINDLQVIHGSLENIRS
jgi:hypothetical protein